MALLNSNVNHPVIPGSHFAGNGRAGDGHRSVYGAQPSIEQAFAALRLVHCGDPELGELFGQRTRRAVNLRNNDGHRELPVQTIEGIVSVCARVDSRQQ